MKKVTYNALTMVRGEDDITWSSMYYHCLLGFDRLIVISHVHHFFLRSCVDKLRSIFTNIEIDFIEIEDENNFSKRKATYVNNAFSVFWP
jgi:hypothetical protein